MTSRLGPSVGLPTWLKNWPPKSNADLPVTSATDELASHYRSELQPILADSEVQSCLASAGSYLSREEQQEAFKSMLTDAALRNRFFGGKSQSTRSSRTEQKRDIDQAIGCVQRLIKALQTLPPGLQVGIDLHYLLLRHARGNPKAFRTRERRSAITKAGDNGDTSLVDVLHCLISDLQEQSNQLQRSIRIRRQERGSKSQHHAEIDFLLESIRALKRSKLGAREFLLVARIVSVLNELDPPLDSELVNARHTSNIARKTHA